MITTKYLLNRLRLEKQLDSYRQVGAYLGISHTSVKRWDSGGSMSDEHACIVAEMLDLDVDLVLLSIIAERSKSGRAINALARLTQELEDTRQA